MYEKKNIFFLYHYVQNTPNVSSNTNLITVITNPHHHTSTNEPILYILSLPPSLRLVW